MSSDLFWEVFKWFLWVVAFLVISFIWWVYKDRPSGEDYRTGRMYMCLTVLGSAVLFVIIYVVRLQQALDQEIDLRYSIEHCLKQNRKMTYWQCKRETIDIINSRSDWYID